MSSSPKSYDVFISFRGEDTRTGFTSHLYSALCSQKIETYIDYKLERGNEVWPKLVEAIRGSDISLVIFSENYATSKWCLEELRETLECRKYRGQVVLPVFYNIDPSDIRKQTGSYEKAFAKHNKDAENNTNGKEQVSQWKAALTEAANISGWDSRTYGNDSQLIENIVNDVRQKQSLKFPTELGGLVEIGESIKHIESSLNKVPRIGIWGMGGIGKTTIARKMFAKHFAQFDSVCFLENVRGESEKLGLASVRNKLFSELLKEQITSSDLLGDTFIQRRLGRKRVFIVLDDVNNDSTLEYLSGGLSNLGPGSRLVVTTRDNHILCTRVDEIYEVEKWKDAESLKLFSLGAFQQTHPKEGYEQLSQRAIECAGGVPLALKVLGLHLRSREIEDWEDELKSLKSENDSFKEIREVLQVSYNGLRKQEKDIFLDIAFFFKDENKDFVIRILDACGFHARIGIKHLTEKSLITISKSNRIKMHDLLQEMGLDIVQNESIRDPGRRSRLKDIKEVCQVLKINKGTDNALEGIALDLSKNVDLQLQADTFNMMDKLRLLRLYVPLGEKRSANVGYPKLFHRFSSELRYLEWNGYRLKSLPLTFCAKFLVEIHLLHSHIEELWKGTQDLVNLETIDLSECKQLMKLPDLSKASKLKWVYLSGCESLCVVHPSLLSLDTLETLILNRCKKLKSLKSEKQLSSLQKLDVNYCASLKEFSVSSDSIETLDLSKTGVKILHSSIGGLSKLVWLNLGGSSLQNLPNELSCLTSLEELRISNCRPVNKEKLHVLCKGLQSLKLLHLKDCYKLFELPDNINALSSLHELRLDGSNVKKLPTSIKLLENLEILSLENCRKLHSLPELPLFIKEFNVVNCTSLVTVSTLKTFSVKMKGKEKHISFKNEMKLNERSPFWIMEDVLFIMTSAALHNVLVVSGKGHSYNYNSVGVCLPGSSIPEGFEYRTKQSSITIELPTLDQFSHLLGFIYSVVLSPSLEMGQCHVKIQCLLNGREVGHATTWDHNAISGLVSDHVILWYDPFHCDLMLNYFQRSESLELRVMTDSEEGKGGIHVKEFGVKLLCFSDSELGSLLHEAVDLELNLKLELGLKFQLAFDLLQPYQWKEVLVFCYALEKNECESNEQLKSELEKRSQAVLKLIEEESSDMRTRIQNQEQNLSHCILGRAPLLKGLTFALLVVILLSGHRPLSRKRLI